jgi:DNA-binding CsgD family transcriptional regulator
VPYKGDCLAYRTAVLRLGGRWREAIGEATQVSSVPAARQAAKAAALYELAEIHRLRGDAAAADDAYRAAAELGRLPHPGLALLRLAQGDVDAARASITRALAEHHGRHRSALLAAAVEIALAAPDLAVARSACAELEEAAKVKRSSWLRAMAGHAAGTLLVAEGQTEAALARLQEAQGLWRELDMPYEGARTRVALATACEQLGDVDGARLERDAAARAFRDIGAAAALAAIERPLAPAAAGGLTVREIEVLRLVARGHTNRAIAEALDISEKTVARHLSNIFTKLDLPSRAAATAYAFRNGFVE